MAGYDVSVGKALLPGFLSGQDGLAKRVEAVLNQILEAQVTETLGADRHERSEDRQGYRNGYRPRTLYTRIGPVTLQEPQTDEPVYLNGPIFKLVQQHWRLAPRWIPSWRCQSSPSSPGSMSAHNRLKMHKA